MLDDGGKVVTWTAGAERLSVNVARLEVGATRATTLRRTVPGES